jgi:hypothetical protein
MEDRMMGPHTLPASQIREWPDLPPNAFEDARQACRPQREWNWRKNPLLFTIKERRPRYLISEAQLRRMREAGKSTVQIAAFYGCDHTTVLGWLRKFGMSTARLTVVKTDAEIDAFIRDEVPSVVQA